MAPFVALIFAFFGLRRPYVRMKTLAKKRAEAMRSNMLIGLSVPAVLLRTLVPDVASLPLSGAGYGYAGLLAACVATCVVLGNYGGKLVFH